MGSSAIVCFERTGLNEKKHMSHSSKNCLGKRSDQKYIKKGLGGTLCNRAYAVKNYNKYEHKGKKGPKPPNKHNEMLFIFANKSGSRQETKKTKKIKAKDLKKRSYYKIKISSSD